LKRAVKLQPTNERILNNLGLALCRLGKFQDAFQTFCARSRAIDWEFEHRTDAGKDLAAKKTRSGTTKTRGVSIPIQALR